MKVLINRCYGGFGVSHKATMRFAELQGIQLFPFVETRDKQGNINFKKFQPYVEGERAFIIHYSTKPLKADGTYEEDSYWSLDRSADRTNSMLIQVVEEMGEEANGDHAELKIVEIPDGVEFEIDEYDGIESIHEVHRTWS